MQLITENPEFLTDFQRLQDVSLNPNRHTANNAYEHCEMVVNRARQLAQQNYYSEEKTTIIINLAYLHDIGKTAGTSKPEKSVELLTQYGDFDQAFVNLIKYHDINLPWYISHMKSESPTNKAWQRLSRRVNLPLLCLFMIADRIDCPGGWTDNKALMWFLEQSRQRGFLTERLAA